MSDVKELTVQSLGDAVREKVRKAMMDALPDEAIQKLIQAEFKGFFEAKTGYHGNEPTPFQLMVRKEVADQVSVRVKAQIADLLKDHVPDWGPFGSKLVGPIVEECAPAALKAVIGNITGMILSQLRSQSGGM